MLGNSKESFNERFSYGVSSGPIIVAVQDNRLPSAFGNAEIPGVGDIMSCMSSLCSLYRMRNFAVVSRAHFHIVTFKKSMRSNEPFSDIVHISSRSCSTEFCCFVHRWSVGSGVLRILHWKVHYPRISRKPRSPLARTI